MTYDNQIDTIKKQRKMLNIQRLAGTRKIRSYNLAEHSYFVGLMFQEFADTFEIEYTARTLGTVLKHDFMEVFTADLPYPVKNLNDVTKTAWDMIEEQVVKSKEVIGVTDLFSDKDIQKYLTPEQLCLLKWCDMLELVLFCLEEKAMGNIGYDLISVLETSNEVLSSEYFVKSYSWCKDMTNIYNRFISDPRI